MGPWGGGFVGPAVSEGTCASVGPAANEHRNDLGDGVVWSSVQVTIMNCKFKILLCSQNEH